MKKKTSLLPAFGSAVVLIAVVAALLWFWMWNKQRSSLDLSYVLVADVADYANAHEGRLPKSWDEFCLWANGKNPARKWDEEGLKKRFSLAWNEGVANYRTVDPNERKLLVVTDPKLKPQEMWLNDRLLNLVNIPPR